MNIYDYEPLERLEICMFLATLDNLDFTNISPEVEGLLVEFEEAGIIIPNDAIAGRSQVDFTPKGQHFRKRAVRWLETQGKLGLVELAILEKVVSSQNTDVSSWIPLKTELGEANLAEIEAAIEELKNSDLIKPLAVMGLRLPVSLIGLNEYRYTLQTKNPPAWQDEKEYSNMTTNNNISIGDYATVGVAGTNNGSVSQQFSNTLSTDEKAKISQKLQEVIDTIQGEKDIPEEVSENICTSVKEAESKILIASKDVAHELTNSLKEEVINESKPYIRNIVSAGLAALLSGILPIFQ